jgi:hypothetical protein
MRAATYLVFGGLVGCGSSDRPGTDAGVDGPEADAPPVDAIPGCVPTPLLAGARNLEEQGWIVGSQAPATLTYGADHVRLETSTPTQSNTSGMLLLRHPNAIEAGKPYKLRIEMMVVSVGRHNQADAGAGILGAFTPTFGMPPERLQMIYLDSNEVGWADNSQSFAFNVQDGAYHTYELSVDEGSVARFSVDGTQALMRSNYLNNGLFAIGDQTNDANLDSVLQIRAITKLCL